MTNPTAAQPLYLDKLEALRQIGQAWMSEEGRDALEDWIEHARAAQPESATGTTGAITREKQLEAVVRGSVDDLERIYAALGMGEADVLDADKVIETIADLRAQLAARGQGKAVARMNYAFDRGIDWLVPYTTIPEGTRLYVAPVSAQPSDERLRNVAQSILSRWDKVAPFDMLSDEHIALRDALEVSAQPDRGAVLSEEQAAVPVDKDAEKAKFIEWSQVFHRNARSYTARDFDHGLAAWLARAAMAAAPSSAAGKDGGDA